MSVVVEYLRRQNELEISKIRANRTIRKILSDGGNKRLESCLKYWRGYSKYLRNQPIVQNNKADFYDMLVKISEEKLNSNG